MLTIRGLAVSVQEEGRTKQILRGIDLTVPARSISAIVGGSGSGKTTAGLAVMRLLAPGLRVDGGEITLGDERLLSLPAEKMRRVRGGKIAMVFQEPLHAFNPLFTIRQQIEEVLAEHTDIVKAKRVERVRDLLAMAGVKDVNRVANAYPHQLSGGLRQRSMIAQALAGGPKLLVADEPTSSLDVTVQARVLDLFRRLRRELDLSILLITHDLGVVRHLADEVAVMHQGLIVESGPVSEVMLRPKDEYTRRLMTVMNDREGGYAG